MQDLLKSLYRVYCERKGQYDLPQEAEDAFQNLVKSLSKEDKHLLLIVEDAHNMATEQAAERSFICGFRLAALLAMELIMDAEEYEEGAHIVLLLRILPEQHIYVLAKGSSQTKCPNSSLIHGQFKTPPAITYCP